MNVLILMVKFMKQNKVLKERPFPKRVHKKEHFPTKVESTS